MRIPIHLVRPGDIVLNRRIIKVMPHPDNDNVFRLITEDGTPLDSFRDHEVNVERREGK